MIRIDDMTRGRFGNRILHYTNLTQLADVINTETSCVSWEGEECFDSLAPYKELPGEKQLLDWDEMLEIDFSSLSKNKDYVVGEYCLHNVFWKLCKNNPRKFLQINDTYKRSFPEDEVSVGIHIRGTDILGADGNQGREIHLPEYYQNAINEIEANFENTKYYVCTDDPSFISFVYTMIYIDSLKRPYEIGTPNHFSDFAILSECDVLVASSSTFAIAAGFTGKENKKIIHSMEWIQKNLDHTLWHKEEDSENIRKCQLSFDEFWVELYKGGNEFYNVWRFV